MQLQDDEQVVVIRTKKGGDKKEIVSHSCCPHNFTCLFLVLCEDNTPKGLEQSDMKTLRDFLPVESWPFPVQDE